MYRKSKTANFFQTPAIATMKLNSNVQSATIYTLINFEPYKAINARDIKPSPSEFQKFPKIHFFKVRFYFTFM